MILPLLLIACFQGDNSSDDDDDDGGMTTAEDTDTPPEPECATVNPGDDWAWKGACPGMPTPVVIAVDGCALTLDYEPVGGMTMGMPYSGTVEGDTVIFADDDSVTGCVGTVEDADNITGECESGCTFALRR